MPHSLGGVEATTPEEERLVLCSEYPVIKEREYELQETNELIAIGEGRARAIASQLNSLVGSRSLRTRSRSRARERVPLRCESVRF